MSNLTTDSNAMGAPSTSDIPSVTDHSDEKVDVPVVPDDQTDDHADDHADDQTDAPDQDAEIEDHDDHADDSADVPADVAPADAPVERPVVTWNGQRPFAGAVAQYCQVLTNAVADAEEQLDANPGWNYAIVELPLFDTLDVECTDQFGNVVVKSYAFHEAHYGPLKRQVFPPHIPHQHHKWLNFYNRSQDIWVVLGQPGKAPGGDGSGKDGTACAPFRDMQVALLQKGHFLIDASEVVFDEAKGRFWYKINIAIYRSPPRNGPVRAPHGYGFIPGLGPAMKAKQDQDAKRDVEVKFESATPAPSSTSQKSAVPAVPGAPSAPSDAGKKKRRPRGKRTGKKGPKTSDWGSGAGAGGSTGASD
ncbi:hypothetical protein YASMINEVIRUS_1390 [Yasminevirus sp. GU-2018]|uniref:Uncharacterized protein n=1 Tax=Yasminevirus sp. GU-2018 TaxID=2420051 RepID=A0A5K0UA11_9VIRU|nr:hypothetical protein YASMINEVIRUS_1390 [Yasminevirus sp. GU-2018]